MATDNHPTLSALVPYYLNVHNIHCYVCFNIQKVLRVGIRKNQTMLMSLSLVFIPVSQLSARMFPILFQI